MAEDHLINIAEASLASALFERLASTYNVSDRVSTIEFNPFGDEVDDFEFKQSAKPIHKIEIYQSEMPSLFINLDTHENPPMSHVLSISFFIDTVRETDGEEIHEAMSEIEMLNDLAAVSKITAQFGFNKNLGSLDLIEGLIYYRQAILLEKKMKECKLFRLDDTFYVTASVHGVLDEKDEALWEYCQKSMDKSLAEILTEVGFKLS